MMPPLISPSFRPTTYGHIPASPHFRAPALAFGALTPGDITRERLLKLIEKMQASLAAGQVRLPGAEVSSDPEVDVATMIVQDSSQASRHYHVIKSRYALTKTEQEILLDSPDLAPPDTQVCSYEFMQYRNGQPGEENRMKSIRLTYIPAGATDSPYGGGRHVMTYQEFEPVPKKFLKKATTRPLEPLSSNDPVVVRAFQDFIKTLEQQGMFDPKARLEEARNEDDLEF